jgi:hypothetical protein
MDSTASVEDGPERMAASVHIRIKTLQPLMPHTISAAQSAPPVILSRSSQTRTPAASSRATIGSTRGPSWRA